jgi:hypothetical protein
MLQGYMKSFVDSAYPRSAANNVGFVARGRVLSTPLCRSQRLVLQLRQQHTVYLVVANENYDVVSMLIEYEP